ncbi:MAG: hypothetical protein ACR65O_01220 [Methylomicrobium sp.]
MAGSVRQFSWRQGDVLTGEAAIAIGYCAPENVDATFVVVISHDCDMTAEVEKEPVAELIVGLRIEKLGSDSYGKTARRLHIEYQTQNGPITLELAATAKQPIEKQKLFDFVPRNDIWLDGRGIGILQRWLAARYHRAAFPEAFEDRLRAAVIPGRRTFLKKIESILSDGGEHIRALLFDLDDGKSIERKTASDVYQLGIVVLYDSTKDESTAATAAEKAAQDLEKHFNTAFHSIEAGWQNICLLYCDPVSDNAITVAQREMLKQWRLEHMSLQDDRSQPMITG